MKDAILDVFNLISYKLNSRWIKYFEVSIVHHWRGDNLYIVEAIKKLSSIKVDMFDYENFDSLIKR